MASQACRPAPAEGRSAIGRGDERFPEQGRGLTSVGFETGGVQAIVHVASPPLPDDQIGGAEDGQVLGDGGLGDPQLGDEGVHAERPLRLKTRQEREETQTRSIAEGLVEANQAVQINR